MGFPLFKGGRLLFCTNPQSGEQGLARTCCPEKRWVVLAVDAGNVSGTSPACTGETFTDLPAEGDEVRYGNDYAQNTAQGAALAAMGNAGIATACGFYCEERGWAYVTCGNNTFAGNYTVAETDYEGDENGAVFTLKVTMNDCGGACNDTQNKYLQIQIAGGDRIPEE